ncbi:MAG: hypothetical protein Q8M16_15655 [Pirellulaceae bacterium]|nr:hypothetical protein [Pirellulaceae bacterium]
MRCCVAKLCCGLILLFAGLAHVEAQDASPPELTRLFPPGVQRGQTTMVQIQGKFQADSVRVWSSEPGLTWTKAEAEGQFQVVIDPTAEVGAVLVRLVDAGGVSEVLPFVVGQHPELNEVEPNDRSNQSQTVSQKPIVINGVLQTGGDVDHFQFALHGGERLVAFLDAERFLKSAVDATLQLVTTDGQILAQNLDYRGLDPQVVWVADRDVDVVLRVFGFPAAPDSTISLGGGEKFLYRLNVTTGAVVEAIAPLTLTKDRPLRFVRHGWNLPLAEEPFELPSDGAAKMVTLSWPDAMGHLKVPVVSHPSWLATDVRLSENRLARADETAKAISLPSTITGNLEQARQVDNFVVLAPANKQWRVHLEAAELGYAWDPVIEVLQVSDGKRLHRQDDQGSRLDPDWTWAPSEGVYQLRVFDLHGHGGPHQWYRLSLTEIVPEVRLTVEKTSYRGKAGEVIEIPVAIDRRHGFAADLEFELRASDDSRTGVHWFWSRCDRWQAMIRQNW